MSARLPWVSVSICSEPLPWLTILSLIWKPWRQRQRWKWSMFIIFSHIWKQQQRETLESICIIVYCLCHGRQMWKVQFAIVHRLFAHLKNAWAGKEKKVKLAIVYHQRAEILAWKCAIVYHQHRWKFKICNSLPSALLWTSRRREITKVAGEGIFWENGITQQRYVSSHNLTNKDHNVKVAWYKFNM